MERKCISTGAYDLLQVWQREREGYGILAYLVSKKFNIIRLPTYYDRVVASLEREDICQYYDKLDSLLEDLDSAYNYTQKRLQQEGYDKDDKIKLERRICKYDYFKNYNLQKCEFLREESKSGIHPMVLASHILNMKNSGNKTLEIEIDTLSSWSLASENELGLYSVYGEISLLQEAKIKDILFFNINENTTDNPLETNEILFINRSDTGLIEFDLDKITISQKFHEEKIPLELERRYRKEYCAEQFENYSKKRKIYLPAPAFSNIEVPEIKIYKKLLMKFRLIK